MQTNEDSLSAQEQFDSDSFSLMSEQELTAEDKLYQAIEQRSLHFLKIFVKEYRIANGPDSRYFHALLGPNQKTALELARAQKHDAIIAYILKDMTLGVKLKKVLIEEAILNHQIEVLKALHSKNISFANMICNGSKTPLDFACEQGNVEIISYLLSVLPEEHLDLDVIIKDAVLKNQLEILKTLAAKNIVLDRTLGKSQRTALHIASKYGNLLIVEFLLSLNHGTDIQDKYHKTAFELALQYKHPKICYKILFHQARIVLQAKKNENPPLIQRFIAHYEEKSIYHAVLLQRLDVLRKFDQLALNQPFSHLKINLTPLHLAAQMNLPNVCLELINRGVDINATDDEDNTPLHLATRQQHLDVIKILLANYASQHLKNKDFDTPLQLAWESNNLDIYLLYLNRLFDVNRQFFQAKKSPLAKDLASELQKIQGNKIINISQYDNQCRISSFFQQYQGVIDVFHQNSFSPNELSRLMQDKDLQWSYDKESGPTIEIKATNADFTLSLQPTPSQLGNLYLHDCATYDDINRFIQSLMEKIADQEKKKELMEVIVKNLKKACFINSASLQTIYPSAKISDVTKLNHILFLVFYLEPLRRLTKDKIDNCPADKTPAIPIALANVLAFELIRQGHLSLSEFLSAKENNYNPATGFAKKSLSTQEGYFLALRKILMLENEYMVAFNPQKVNRRFYLKLLLSIYTELDDINAEIESHQLDGYDSSDEDKAERYKIH